MNLSSTISARAARLPLIYLLPTPDTIPYFRHGLGSYPDLGQHPNPPASPTLDKVGSSTGPCRTGMGVRIPLREFTGARVLTEVERVTKGREYRERAGQIQRLVRATDGAGNAAEAILDFIVGQ